MAIYLNPFKLFKETTHEEVSEKLKNLGLRYTINIRINEKLSMIDIREESTELLGDTWSAYFNGNMMYAYFRNEQDAFAFKLRWS